MKKSHWIFVALFALVLVSFFGMNGYAQESSLLTMGAGGVKFPLLPSIHEGRMFAIVLVLSLALINCMVLAKKYNLLFRKAEEQVPDAQMGMKR